MTTTATHQWDSVEQCNRYSVEQCNRYAHGGNIESNGTWHTPEKIAERMFELQCGVWHASNSLLVDAIASGEAGYGVCEFCGGPTAPNQNNVHQLCKARAEVGRETPRLDSVPPCYCAPCEKARGPF